MWIVDTIKLKKKIWVKSKMHKIWGTCVIGIFHVVSLVYIDRVRKAFNQMIEMKKWKGEATIRHSTTYSQSVSLNCV